MAAARAGWWFVQCIFFFSVARLTGQCFKGASTTIPPRPSFPFLPSFSLSRRNWNRFLASSTKSKIVCTSTSSKAMDGQRRRGFVKRTIESCRHARAPRVSRLLLSLSLSHSLSFSLLFPIIRPTLRFSSSISSFCGISPVRHLLSALRYSRDIQQRPLTFGVMFH